MNNIPRTEDNSSPSRIRESLRTVAPGAAAVGGASAAALFFLFGSSGLRPVTAQEASRVLANERATAVALENTFSSVSDSVRPATVYITAQAAPPDRRRSSEPGAPGPDGDPDGFEQFFQDFGPRVRPQRPGPAPASNGSGVIVRPDGYILTNDHVVAAGANGKVTVTLENGRQYVGKVFRDRRTDLAVIKVNAEKPLPYVALADSDSIRVGQWAIAIGSPFGQQNSVTTGIVSALHRKSNIGNGAEGRYYPNLIQTDASINPGNSGGPLLNIRGELIGVNVAIFSPSGASIGIGFAIPSNTAKSVMNQLIANGRVTRGYLGLTPEDIPIHLQDRYRVEKGARVRDVEGNAPADKGGIRENDIITRFGTRDIFDEVSLREAITSTPPGTTVPVSLLRAGKPQTLNVTVGAFPEERLGGTTPEQTAPQTRKPAPVVAPLTTRKLGLIVKPLPAGVSAQYGLGSGVLVEDVELGGPAWASGLIEGDIITQADGSPVNTIAALEKFVAAAKSGETLTLNVYRPVNPQIGLQNPLRKAVDITVP